jgi:predicted nucleic acid-binding protein
MPKLPGPVPLVVVDSNAIVKQSWYLDSPAWRLLLHQAEHGEICLLIPRVVLIEVLARYRQELDAALDAERKAIRALGPLMRETKQGEPDRSADQVMKFYEETVLDVLAGNGINVADIPAVDLESFVSRAATRKRPFDDNGHGFRDALVWETLVVSVDSDIHSEVIFITRDGDYLAEKSKAGLHSDLVIDCKVRLAVAVRHHLQIHDYLKDAYSTDDHALMATLADELDAQRGHLEDQVEGSFFGASEIAFQDFAGRIVIEDVDFHGRPQIHLVGVLVGDDDNSPLLVELSCIFDVTIKLSLGSADPTVRELREEFEVPATALYEQDVRLFGEIELDGVGSRIRAAAFDSGWTPMSGAELRKLAAGQTPMVDPALIDAFRNQTVKLPDGFLDSFQVPTVKLPQSFLDSLNIPMVNFPVVKLPQSFLDSLNIPMVNFPVVKLPQSFLDSLKIPMVNFPVVKLPQSFFDAFQDSSDEAPSSDDDRDEAQEPGPTSRPAQSKKHDDEQPSKEVLPPEPPIDPDEAGS